MLAGNDNIHESLDEFDIRRDPITGVSPFSWLFSICSFPCLQVTMTCMRAQTSLNFGLIGPLTVESHDAGQMSKMAATPIYGKTLKKPSSPEPVE